VLKQLGIIDEFVPWLKSPNLAMPTVIFATIWKMFPFMFVILYAGLQAIPEEQIEASKVDGANGIQRFIHITLPNMREIIALSTILEFIWQFQYITIIWTTTKGGPINKTTTLPVLIYRVSFRGSMNMGYTSAVGIFWLLFLLGFSIVYIRFISIIIILILVLLPIYWMLNTSFKFQPEIFKIPPTLFPKHFTFSNYVSIIAGNLASSIPFLTYFKNSMIVTIASVVLTLFLATPAGYVFSRMKFFGRRTLIYVVLISQMLPIVLILIPIYTLFLKLRLLSTYIGLILPYLMFTLPFSIWMLKGYFDSIPTELDDAAKVDGCTKFQAFLRVILPNVRPGITATAIVAFIMCWDEFIIALTIMDKNEMRTLPVGIIQSFVGQFSIKWGEMMAASVITTIPVVLIFIFLSKHLIGGLTKGAVKG